MEAAALARLRADIAAIEAATPATRGPDSVRNEAAAMRFDVPVLDRLFPRGMSCIALHEFSSAGARNAASLAGFVTALLARLPDRGPIVWVSQIVLLAETGSVFAPGVSEFGIDPGRLLLVRSGRSETVLWTMEEALAAGGLTAVVAEFAGDPRVLDLTASRRIALRSARRGTPALLLRHGREPTVSAARTHWRIAPWPSPKNRWIPDLVGAPAWHVDVIRNRDGRCGSARIAFDPGTCRFSEPFPLPEQPSLRAGSERAVAEHGR